MPISTFDPLSAYDRQRTLMTCHRSIVELISSSKEMKAVNRDDFALLLHFLHDELTSDDALNFRNRSDSDRQDLYLTCQRTITDLIEPSEQLPHLERDNLYLLLNFLHDEMDYISEVIEILIQESERTSATEPAISTKELSSRFRKASGDVH